MSRRLGPPRSYKSRERCLTCPSCHRKYRTNTIAWVCDRCGDDATVAAVAEITAGLLRQTSGLTTCPIDGCLIRPGENCPACQARAASRLTRCSATVRRGTVRLPLGWVRRGAILVKRKAA